MRYRKWQLQEAKNKFSEVVRLAAKEGPQTITKHGKASVIVLSMEDYQKMRHPDTNLIEFFQNSPLASVELEVNREKSQPRNIIL